MTDPDDLVEFLRARLDEDEQVARDALLGYPASMHASAGQPALPLPTPTTPGAEWRAEYQNVRRTDGFRVVAEAAQASAQVAEHIARHDPARVLADVAAKRRIAESYREERARRDAYQADDARATESAEQATRRRSSAARCRGLEIAVELLALPYVSHPDYRREWTT